MATETATQVLVLKHAESGYKGEVLHNPANAKEPYRARIVASNGQVIFWTENYVKRESAENPLRKLGFA